MTTEQITIRLPINMVAALREGAKVSRRSLAAEVAFMLDQSPLKQVDDPAPRHDLAEQVRVLGADSLLPK